MWYGTINAALLRLSLKNPFEDFILNHAANPAKSGFSTKNKYGKIILKGG